MYYSFNADHNSMALQLTSTDSERFLEALQMQYNGWNWWYVA